MAIRCCRYRRKVEQHPSQGESVPIVVPQVVRRSLRCPFALFYGGESQQPCVRNESRTFDCRSTPMSFSMPFSICETYCTLSLRNGDAFPLALQDIFPLQLRHSPENRQHGQSVYPIIGAFFILVIVWKSSSTRAFDPLKFSVKETFSCPSHSMVYFTAIARQANIAANNSHHIL